MQTKKKTFINRFYSLNPQFETERQTIINRAVILGSLLCTILVPLYGVLDLIFKPHILFELYTIRIIASAICFSTFYLSKKSYGRQHAYLMASILFISVCGSIALMCHIDIGPGDPYYAGMNLPIVGMGIMCPFTIMETVFLGSVIWLIYVIPNLFMVNPDNLTLFLSNNFFIVSTIVISVAGTQFNLRHRLNQWNAHKELRSAHRKIKNHAKELEEKVQERTQRLLQSERLAVVGQLAGGVAHDFNNILTAILGISQLLLDDLPKQDPMRDDVESISRVGHRAVDLVKQLLAFSRRQILQPKYLNLNEILREVENMLCRVIGENIMLAVHTDPLLGKVLADPVQIEQIILNLCVNARDAMPDGGKLILETKNVHLDRSYCQLGKVSLSPGDYVLLAVSDTGEGMSSEVKAKIFEPFFTTKEPGEGTGLGLSTVYGIVKQSNGDILVYSEPGKGTTLKIYLPRISKKEISKEESKVKNLIPLQGKETILLVEDEQDVRNLTARMLTKQGYRVLQAEEGSEALRVAEGFDGSIDLLITDVVMPNMSGKDLASRLQSERKDLKVLFISGHSDRMITHQGIDEREIEFLQKPFTMESLSVKIRNVFKA